MKDDVQNYRKSSWAYEQLRLLPHLVLVKPWGQEGSYDIDVVGSAPALFLCDHNWDETFGYAFGEVHAIGAEALRHFPTLGIDDFIHFTRCAYDDAKDCYGEKWLFVNWENIIAKIDADPNPANGVLIQSREEHRGLDGRAAAA